MQFGASESILHWAKYRPHSPAILHNGRVLSFWEFNELVDRVCLAVTTVKHDGERVGLAARSKLNFLVSLIAVLRCGKSAVLLNTGLTDEGLRTNLLDTEVSLLVHDESYKRISTLTADRTRMNTLGIRDLLAAREKAPSVQPVERGPDDEWGVLFSSGTTGIPKGIERDQNSMVTEFLGWCLELGLTRHTKFYVGRPIYYTGGLVLSMATLIVGGQIVINDYANDNNPDEVWRDYQQTLKSTKVDWAFFVPDQIRAFLKLAKKTEPRDAAGSILVMGAPISGDEKVKASKALGSKVVESWGNTESLGTITDPEDLETRPDSIGRPFLTDELYVVNEDCKVLGSNQIGRIAGSEEAGFSKYSNRPRETEIAKRDRLIVSEDVGFTDSDGYFYVRGRQQDCLVIGGETLFIPSIEEKIRGLEDVEECCVCATGDEISVQLVAVLVPRNSSSIDLAKLLSSINGLLGQNEELSRIVPVKSIPRVSSGKPDRVAIAQLVQKS
jgi:acyl-coenzyme A synthetase/AMP-(fatty) acid ligase